MEALEIEVPYPDEVSLAGSWAVLDVILRDEPDMSDRFSQNAKSVLLGP